MARHELRAETPSDDLVAAIQSAPVSATASTFMYEGDDGKRRLLVAHRDEQGKPLSVMVLESYAEAMQFLRLVTNDLEHAWPRESGESHRKIRESNRSNTPDGPLN